MSTVGYFVLAALLAIAIIAGVDEAIKKSEKYFEHAENNPSMNTNDWDQHRRRLNKFQESKYKDTHFYVGPKGGVYYITYRGTKVYC